MNKRSFIDLTALLDVVLILFFAAAIQLSQSQQQVVQAAKDNQLALDEARVTISQLEQQRDELERAVVDRFGTKLANVGDYRSILDKISIIQFSLIGEDNLLMVNDQSSHIHIIRASFDNDQRLLALQKRVASAIDKAITGRDKSDIIYIKVVVSDDDVYKYAVDFFIEQLQQAIVQYGRDKVILQMWND